MKTTRFFRKKCDVKLISKRCDHPSTRMHSLKQLSYNPLILNLGKTLTIKGRKISEFSVRLTKFVSNGTLKSIIIYVIIQYFRETSDSYRQRRSYEHIEDIGSIRISATVLATFENDCSCSFYSYQFVMKILDSDSIGSTTKYKTTEVYRDLLLTLP